MKFQAIFGLLFLFVISVLAGRQCQRKPNGAECANSGQCISKYCLFGKCDNWGKTDDERGLKNPCNKMTCPKGEECQIQSVQCFRAPCPGIAGCNKVARCW